MKKVTTPQGTMNIAGSLRATGGFLFDLCAALILLSIFIRILDIVGVSAIEIKVMLLCMGFIYPYLSQREIVPGLGRWALGLHRFSFSDIEEYAGKGILVVYEPLEPRIYTVRTVIAAASFAFLYLLAVLLA